MNKPFLQNRTTKYFLIILLIAICSGTYFADHNLLQGEEIVESSFFKKGSKGEEFDMSVHFKNVESQKIKDSFEKVWNRYQSLHKYEITLVQQSIGNSTMQAQPIITLRSLFDGVKRYRINIGHHVRDEESLVLEKLPEPILIGWFAHELGHVMDYQQHSNLSMIRYGFKYYFSERFKKTVEHAADYIAIANGFQDEVLATKQFILGDERISPTYKSRIKRYYLPENQVMVCSEDKEMLEPYYNL